MLKILQSSVNPEKLSLTIKGVIPLILIVLALAGYNASEVQLNEVIDLGIDIISKIGVAVTGVIALIGAVRKLIVLAKNIFKK